MQIEKITWINERPVDAVSFSHCDMALAMKINEIIDLLNNILAPVEFKPTGKFYVEIPDSDKAV